MPDVTADDIAEAALAPASASVDGQSASAQPIDAMIKARQNQATANALDGTNDSGGAKSGWNRLRPGKVKLPSAV